MGGHFVNHHVGDVAVGGAGFEEVGVLEHGFLDFGAEGVGVVGLLLQAGTFVVFDGLVEVFFVRGGERWSRIFFFDVEKIVSDRQATKQFSRKPRQTHMI